MTNEEIAATLIAAHRLVKSVHDATGMRPDAGHYDITLFGEGSIQFVRSLGARPGAWYAEPRQRCNEISINGVTFKCIETADEEVPYVKGAALEARVDEIIDEATR
ncbi:hypothetical protein LCGC14_1109350 [marine sediment metagenome]|uniref:Uncharacterized protein n=1 Tax=marine sediment metagenome TaxID=412755 RepID=A0A0F9MC33_9ZZZZ